MSNVISFAAARKRVAPTGDGRGAATLDFLKDLEVEGRSARTIGEHRAELRRYAVWLDEQQIDWAAVTPADLSSYARTRADRGASSRASLIITLRVFYAWCHTQERVTRNPADRLRTPRRPKAAPRALSHEQIAQLLAYVDQVTIDKPGRAAERDRALILFGLYTGFRAAEMAALRWSAVDLVGLTVTVVEGKGARGRTVKLHAGIVAELTQWRVVQSLSPDAPVFSLTASPIAPDRVGKIVHKIAKKTGLPLTAHVLRHSFATTALRRSHHLYSVSRALGHRHIQTTMIYLRRDASDTDAAVDSLPNRDEW